MLEELELRNLGTMTHAILEPSPHMTAITGETGAGKSMLLSAMKLISAQRYDTSRIASDAQEAWAQAVFVEPRDGVVAHLLEEAGISSETNEEDAEKIDVYVSRTVPKTGRSRCAIDGKGAPKSLLQTLCSHMVTIHGQSEQLQLAVSSKQRELLDNVAGNAQIRRSYAEAFNAYRKAQEVYERLQHHEASERQRADYLRESLERIRAVDPHANEDEELSQRRERIEHASRIAHAVGEAMACLDASQLDMTDMAGKDAIMLLDQAAKALQSVSCQSELVDLSQRLQQIESEVAEIVLVLATSLDVGANEADLDDINARLHALQELTKRWGPTLADVIAWAQDAAKELEALDDSPEAKLRAKQECERCYQQAYDLAKQLMKTRQEAAKTFEREVTKELDSLAMVGAQLHILVEALPEDATSHEVPLDVHGCDTVEFFFKPFPTSDDLPIGKSASGGELSRFMLAMELVSFRLRQQHNETMTFIFDEIDAGVGGNAAVELGRRLAQLAKHAQVIVVTHLAQVASFADRQFVVRKTIDEDDVSSGRVTTRVTRLEGESRVQEIARMLAGSQSQTSLEHAQELLATSRCDVSR